MTGRFARLVTLMVIAPLLVASPARAADDIGLSLDGRTWSNDLSTPLFDPAMRWVPGDRETATFYVRNQGPSAAVMTIEARSADTDELLADDDIRLAARVDGASWVDLDNGVTSESLTERSIARNDVVKVDVSAAFDPASTNRSQVKRLGVDFTVTISDALDGSSTDPGGDDDADSDADAGESDADAGSDSAGLLPGAGAPVGGWLPVTAVGALILGLFLARRRRGQEVSS